jgi:hypothetical protein
MAEEVGEIRCIKVEGEFRVCLNCGYDRGFHSSYLNLAAGKPDPVKSTSKLYRIILICPNCGARYDVGLKVTFTEESPCVVSLPLHDNPHP